jgi:hypothetical protein
MGKMKIWVPGTQMPGTQMPGTQMPSADSISKDIRVTIKTRFCRGEKNPRHDFFAVLATVEFNFCRKCSRCILTSQVL